MCRSSWQRSSTDDLPLLPLLLRPPFSSCEPLVPAIYARFKIPRHRPRPPHSPPHPRCSPIASASSLTNDPTSSSFRPLKIFENSRHSPRCILFSSSTLLFLLILCLKTAFRTLFPLFPGHAEFLRFFLLTPPCLGFWGFLVTTLSLGGIDRYNKINFPFSLVHPSTHGPKETEGSKFSSTSVIIRPGSNFRPVVGQAVSLFPPRSNSGGTIS